MNSHLDLTPNQHQFQPEEDLAFSDLVSSPAHPQRSAVSKHIAKMRALRYYPIKTTIRQQGSCLHASSTVTTCKTLGPFPRNIDRPGEACSPTQYLRLWQGPVLKGEFLGHVIPFAELGAITRICKFKIQVKLGFWKYIWSATSKFTKTKAFQIWHQLRLTVFISDTDVNLSIIGLI